jgi:hypothetical protein
MPDSVREELAWAAGLFEGEGCFSGSLTKQSSGRAYWYGMASLAQVDANTTERFAAAVGCGRLHTRAARGTSRAQRCWAASAIDDLCKVVRLLYPWLSERRRQAAVDMLCKDSRLR